MNNRNNAGFSNDTITQFAKQVIPTNNMMRNEKILILPYNTLRVFDLFVQADLYKAKDPNWKGDFMKTLKEVLTRSEKDLGKVNDIDSELVKKLMNDSWMHYYDLAPRTNAYSMLETLGEQKFISDMIVLFHKKNCHDEEFTNAYYDGSIEELEKFISENDITAVMMDDVELLMTLINRGNLDLNWMTFFISKMGYNYTRTEHGSLVMKHSTEWTNKYAIEVAGIRLI